MRAGGSSSKASMSSASKFGWIGSRIDTESPGIISGWVPLLPGSSHVESGLIGDGVAPATSSSLQLGSFSAQCEVKDLSGREARF